MTPLRICKGCKRELPISEFYSPASGTRYNCKVCENKYSKTYRKTHRELKRQWEKEYIRKNSMRRWATACLSGHRRRGYVIEMTCQELYEMATRTDSCFICGIPLDWQLGNKGRMKKNSSTLDRVENESVIRKYNVLILCYKCNATKRDRTLREFSDYCEGVVTRPHSHFEYPHLVHL
jgi:hypothetical protein